MLKYLESISYRDTGQFPDRFLDYVDKKQDLRPFYDHFPDLEGFSKKIKERRNFSSQNRSVLVQHLEEQYQVIPQDSNQAVFANIELLKRENTFTITTGHQLNLFTGPLYFIYKILTVIRLAEELKSKFPKDNFVPVYWMASEDHDFEEIQYFNFHKKKYTWNNDQKGPVGKFSLDEMGDYLKNLPIPLDKLKLFYSESTTLGEAHFKLVNSLFSEFGLIVLDADSKSLKKELAELVKRDIDLGISSRELDKTNSELNTLGYKTQVNPRELNYFYMAPGIRERLEKDSRGFYYLNDKGLRVAINLDKILSESPENISPNVVTRPIYQELILPNLAYIGGPSELAYWLQLKSSFESLDVSYPLLVPRYSVSIISAKAQQNLYKSGLEDIKDIFLEERILFKKILEINKLLNPEQHEEWEKDLEVLFEDVKKEAEKIDTTLGPSVEGRKAKVTKELLKIRKKMESAQIRKQGVIQNRIWKLKSEIFPNNSFQERHDNVSQFLDSDQALFSKMALELKSPLDYKHRVLVMV